MTCCGGSGALADEIATDIRENGRSVAAVLSGNRNFEGRVHPQIGLAYLGAPPLVIAYALLGTVLRDITVEPLGKGNNGEPVYLRDIWPTSAEIDKVVRDHVTQDIFTARYSEISQGNLLWDDIDPGASGAFAWDKESTYILKPPFLETAVAQSPPKIEGAAILAMFGDNVTTDHISPGARILEGTLAGDYLAARGTSPNDFSGFLQRRTNHEVMMRGTFNNAHIQNEMTPGHQGGWTLHQPTGDLTTIFEAHERYRAEGRGLVVVAGREYGTGSSRDWAARGPHLLGVRAIVAEGFERIHRSNLVGMGILPLQFQGGVSRKTLGLDGSETVCITGFATAMEVGQTVSVYFAKPDGTTIEANVLCRLDTAREIAWFEAGGVMPYVLKGITDAA